MKKRNLIFYKGKTQFENTGDLLINRTLLSLLSAHAEIIVDDEELPSEYCEKLLFNIENTIKGSSLFGRMGFNSYLYVKLFKNVFTNALNIYLLDNPGHIFSNKKSPSNSDLFQFYKKRILKLLGCKFLRVGVTIGPFSARMFAFQGNVSKLYSKTLVRDFNTLENVKKFNFKNFDYIPDLAWAYDKEKLKHKNSNLLPSISDKYIVISFRDCIEGNTRNSLYYQNILHCLEEIFEKFKDKIFLLTYQVDYDRAFCQDVFKQFSSTYKLDFIDENLTIDNAIFIYSKSEFVVSNRLHVLLLAIESNTLPFALTDTQNHSKLVGMFTDENCEEFIFDVEDLKLNQLEHLYNQKPEILKMFKNKITNNSILIKNKISELFK